MAGSDGQMAERRQMIRSLRVWHRRLIPVLTILLLVLLAAALGLRSTDPVQSELPQALMPDVRGKE